MAKQTVLLVDADTRSARVLEVSLRKAGYSVTLVKSAAEAIDAIDINPPDLVLSDTRLAPPPSDKAASAPPPMDGYQLCRRLKDDPVLYTIPFIFLTSSSSIEDKIRGLELGVEDYLTKPIYIKEILTRIQLVLAKKTREGMEGRTSRASFTGLLSEMGLVDLLSTIDLGRKSGVLDLEGSMKGTVFFRDGKVVDARCGMYAGAAAIYRMLVWNEGRFEIRFGPCPVEDVIDMSTQGLLMEGMRRLDEWQRLQEQLPSLDSVYEVDTKELASRLGEIPDEVNQILRAFNGERTLLEVVDESGFDDLGALATLSKLFFEGLIYPKPTQPGADPDDASGMVPGEGDDEASRSATSESRVSEPLLDARASVSVPAPPPTSAVAASGSAASEIGMPTANAEPAPAVQVDRGGLSSGTTLDDRGTQASSDDVEEHEERDVAKHRGKRKRAKRDLMPDVGSAAPATSAAPAVPARRDEPESVATAAARATAPALATEARPADDRSPEEREKSRADSMPESRPRTDSSSNVIQFPKSPAIATPATSSTAERADDVPEREFKKTLPHGTVLEDIAKDAKPAVDGKDAKTADAKTPEKRDPAETKPAESTEAKRTPPPPPPEALKSAAAVPPASQPAETRRDSRAPESARKESRDDAAKNKPAAKVGAEKPGATDADNKRERKISFSGELSDEAKAFFQDKSYEAAYKHHHDTFEDLKAEDPPEHKRNKNSMIITGSLVAVAVLVVGGLALRDRFLGVREPTLPPVTSAANSSVGNPGENPAPAPTTNPAPAPSAQPAAPVAHPGATAEQAAAPAAPEPSTPPAAAPPAANGGAPEAPAATAVAAGANPPAAASAAGAPPEAAPPAAPTPPAAAAPPAPAVAAAAAPPVANSPAAAAPPAGQSVADLLHAAVRARSRGARVADQAYQAWVAAGGNDAAAMSSFAYWLASSAGDLGRAADWAQRATAIDANNQQGWYVFGVSRLEGPHADRAAARDALRRCTQLPGPYAAECRGAL